MENLPKKDPALEDLGPKSHPYGLHKPVPATCYVLSWEKEINLPEMKVVESARRLEAVRIWSNSSREAGTGEFRRQVKWLKLR